MTDQHSDETIGQELYTLLKSSTAVFLGRTAGRVGALVGQILIVRALAPATFGSLALAYTLSMLSARVVSNGFREGVTRFVSLAEDEAEYRERFNTGAVLAIVLSVVMATAMYLLRPWLAAVLGDERIVVILTLFVPYLLVYPLAQLFVADFRGRGETTLPVVSQHLLGTGLGIIAFLVVSTFGDPETGAILYWYMPSLSLVAFLGYVVVKRYPPVSMLRSRPDWQAIRELWSYSWPLLLSSSFAVLLGNIDIVMIGYFSDSAAVGEYRAIQPLRQVTLFLLSSTAFLYLPLASGLYDEGRLVSLTNFYKTTTKWVVAGTLPFVLVLSLFAGDTVVAFFGTEYRNAALALSVLMVGMFGRTIVGPSGIMVKAIDRPRVEIFAAAIGLAINLIANVLLITRFGILGAAIGTSIGVIVFNLIETVAIYRTTGGTPLSVDLFKQLVPTILFAVGLERLLSDYRLGILSLLGVGIVLVVVQLCSTILTRSLGDGDIELIDSVADQTTRDLTVLQSFVRRFS